MRDRQHQFERPKIERLPVADKARWLRSFTEIGGCPIVHGALMRDTACQPDKIEDGESVPFTKER